MDTEISPVAPLNLGLFRLHRILFFIMLAFTALVSATGVRHSMLTGAEPFAFLAGVTVLPFAALHWYAAKGAQLGRPYGRVISIIFACVWLLGFPIGTMLAVFVFLRIGKSWQSQGGTDQSTSN